MKTASTTLKDALKTRFNMVALPKATIEWNMNRYFDTTVDNTPAEDTDGYDIEMFPIESIVEPLRPNKGAAKAMAGAAIISDVYEDEFMSRFYVASTDDKYKYWVSPNRSNDSGLITGCQPYVLYEKNLDVNKVVIKVENSWATPVDWVVQFTPNGTDWGTAAGTGNTVTNPIVANDGTVTLWWNGTTWSSTKPASIAATRSVRGFRLVVNALGPGEDVNGVTTSYFEWNAFGNTSDGEYETGTTTGANSHFSLIEMSARLEVDVSDRLLSVSSTFDAGDADQLTPLGNITTNVGTINLWNSDGYFDKDNEASPYVELLEPNAVVNVEYHFYLNGLSQAATDVVQELRMYTGQWSNGNDGTVTVDLEDHSKFLKEDTVPAMMYEDVTLTEVVYRVCDAIGFNNFQITNADSNKDFKIPVWYTDGEESAWEIFDQLSRDTQSLVFFDAWGVLNVKPRYAAMNALRTPNWTLLGIKRGSDLANIVQLDKTGSYEANKIVVMYSNARWSEWNNGNPSMATIWEPEGDLALRAAHIIEDLPATGGTFMRLSPKDAEIWPFSSLANIEGEIIRFDAKQYIYHTGTSTATANTVWLESQDDFEKYKAESSNEFKQLNRFTGKIRIKERGVWNSRQKAHSSSPKSYSIRRFVNGHSITSNRGVVHNLGDSSITLHPAGALGTRQHRLTLTTGDAAQVGDYKHYGTRLSFTQGDGYTDQIAGLVINNIGEQENGYYIEMTPTNKLGSGDRKNRNEVTLYIRKNGKDKLAAEKLGCEPLDLGAKPSVEEIKNVEASARHAVSPMQEYDIDVMFKVLDSGRHRIKVWVNGTVKIDTQIPVADTIAPNTKFGVYIRGKTRANFDYLYAVRDHASLEEPLDDMSFFDRVRGGYYGTYAMLEIPYERSTQNLLPKKNSTKRANNRPDFYFDEFGAQAHEVREFDVKFSEAPVLHSRPFLTNDWNASIIEYNATPFGAKFIIANTSRQNAVINGTENIVYGGGSRDVEHITSVIGRTLTVDEAKQHKVENKDQIRSRGEIETQIDSKWIQSEDAAKEIASWISDFWSTGQDEVEVEIFGNPLFEVGDLVAVDYPAKHMEPAVNTYFVTSISNDFATGLATSLTLRRNSYSSESGGT